MVSFVNRIISNQFNRFQNHLPTIPVLRKIVPNKFWEYASSIAIGAVAFSVVGSVLLHLKRHWSSKDDILKDTTECQESSTNFSPIVRIDNEEKEKKIEKFIFSKDNMFTYEHIRDIIRLIAKEYSGQERKDKLAHYCNLIKSKLEEQEKKEFLQIMFYPSVQNVIINFAESMETVKPKAEYNIITLSNAQDKSKALIKELETDTSPRKISKIIEEIISLYKSTNLDDNIIRSKINEHEEKIIQLLYRKKLEALKTSPSQNTN